ncbi:uncharacterized protein LOC120627884 [Pararge aegeria]|uniref:uncharacterized protein LOC120627884 n=1 Tax=Pararge aegeria TaxID=116150 RepID=UPI0019D0E461|nr:uncharacterized protein LOC120627884 [Pararge aegeria]
MPSPGSPNASYSAHRTAHPESPSRSRCVSPRKASPVGRFPLQNTVSSLVASFDYETDKGDIWDAIPDRDWRLLAALARKREEDIERERLAEQFQKMWLKEKEEREMVETESSEQYKKYLCKKRCREQSYHEYKRMMRKAEQHAKTGQLVSCIRHKEQRAADMLAWRENRKIKEIIGKAVEEEARAQLAAEKRLRRGVAEQWCKQLELVHTFRKADEASKRRNAMLRDASQRLAITNALSSWETSLIRQEAEAVEAAKRATFAAHNALKDAHSLRISKIKDSRTLRARKLAALTAQMREAVRMAT